MTTPDHTLTDDEREALDAAIHASLRGVIDRTRVHEAVETILAARLAAVEAVRDAETARRVLTEAVGDDHA